MEWIHVKDRVPEVGIDVIVWDDNFKTCNIRHRLNEKYPGANDIQNVYVWSDQGVCNSIEYWMPLPFQPERLNEMDHIVESNEMVCESLNTGNKK